MLSSGRGNRGSPGQEGECAFRAYGSWGEARIFSLYPQDLAGSRGSITLLNDMGAMCVSLKPDPELMLQGLYGIIFWSKSSLSFLFLVYL